MRLKQRTTTLLLFVLFTVAGFSQAGTMGFASTYPLAMEGSKTASGEIYISSELTACHASLPFNTLVKVTNLRNKKTVTVRVNDRFAFRNSRVIDISNSAADAIDLFSEITPQVAIEVLGTADATMLAEVQKKQDAAKKGTLTASVKTTPKNDKKSEVAPSTPAPASAPAATAPVTATASAAAAATESGFLSGIKLSIPTVSVQDITNLATVTIKYISLSLFK